MSKTRGTNVSVDVVAQILGDQFGVSGAMADYNTGVATRISNALTNDPLVADRVESEVYAAYMDAVAARAVAARVAATV